MFNKGSVKAKDKDKVRDIFKAAVIGGGASGFFAAIRCAEVCKTAGREADIHIFESSPSFLSKVKISGGGRCNVTHRQFDPVLFCQNYPRGKKELRSPFNQFQAADTVEWFKARGVRLKAEEDGRMFPVTDSSETVIKSFMQNALELGVRLNPRSAVRSLIRREDGKFELRFKEGAPWTADKVLVATGSAKSGYRFAQDCGHSVTELAPSLFTFKISHPVFSGLAGVSFKNVSLELLLPKRKFRQSGPLLITHRGLSGPAVLKLSAWAAREMKRASYRAPLKINWIPGSGREEAAEAVAKAKETRNKQKIKTAPLFGLSKRFWNSLLEFMEIAPEKRWAELSKKEENRLTENLMGMTVHIDGQNRFKEEFVECGGVKLSEVDFKTMESKLCPGLYFSGEVLDIDGITGGFNFQNAWTTGHIAGSNMAAPPDQT